MKYSDLKLIDELLCDLKTSRCPPLSWDEVERYSSITRQAMTRLRTAYRSGEMASITLGLAMHFERHGRDLVEEHGLQ